MFNRRLAYAWAALSLGLPMAAVRADFIYSPVVDSGTSSLTLDGLPGEFTSPVNSPLGTPVITATAGGWKLDFHPGAAYFAGANNSGGNLGATSRFESQLTFDLQFDAPVRLGLNILNDGIYTIVGNAQVSRAGSVSVIPMSPGDLEPPVMLSDWGSRTHFDPAAGIWTETAVLPELLGTYSTYRVSVDNLLISQAPAGGAFASSNLAQLDFTINLTTLQTPEPGTLAILGVGSWALLRSRRR